MKEKIFFLTKHLIQMKESLLQIAGIVVGVFFLMGGFVWFFGKEKSKKQGVDDFKENPQVKELNQKEREETRG